MKKFLFSLFSTMFLFAFSVLPAYAADNFFQQLAHSVGSSLSRFYLMLPGDKPANQVLGLTWDAEQNVKSADTKADVNVDMLNGDTSVANVKLSFAGPFSADDVSNVASYKQDMTVSGEVAMQGTTLKTSGELKNVDKKLYIKLDEVPFVPFFNGDALKGKWIVFNPAENTARSSTELTADQQQKLKDAYVQLLSQMKADTAHKENKDGHDVFVIEATIPKEALAAYIKSVQEITAKPVDAQASPMVTSATEGKNVSNVLDQIGDLKVTLWVDQSSYYIRHIEIPISFSPNQSDVAGVSSMNSAAASLSQVNKINAMLTMDFDKFNEAVSIDTPSDTQDAQTVFQNMIQQSLQPDAENATGAGTSELPQMNAKQLQQLQKLKMLTKDKQQLEQNATGEGAPNTGTIPTVPSIPTGY